MTMATDRYAVIGNPIGHTKSPLIHGAFAQASGQGLAYTAIEAPLDGFAAAVRAFRDAGGRGMSVTAPFKLQAWEIADVRSERAERAGAVNALKFDAGRIHADNFDGVGLVNDIQRNLRLPMRGKRVLLLGAGGAARGILLPFLTESPREMVIANRTGAKARALAQEFGLPGNLRACGYGDIGEASFDVVVNATSASLKDELPPVPASAFQPEGLAYELVYGKGMTPFLKLAKASGVERIADGVGMLVEQAAEAFLWWRGVRPATRPVIEKLTVPLGDV
jgi:shikimate dehydrogenase